MSKSIAIGLLGAGAILFAILLTGCSLFQPSDGQPSDAETPAPLAGTVPSPTFTARPGVTPEPPPAPTSAPTNTPTPEATTAPTATPTPEPTATPTATITQGFPIPEKEELESPELGTALDDLVSRVESGEITEEEAEGVVLYLGPAAVEALLAIRPEEAVIDAVTPVFNLHPDTIRRRLQQAARAAGLPGWRDITGHSGRVGMAQDLSAAGFALPELMTAGRWKSPRMPARYTERQAAGRGAVARYYQGGRG